jgi:2-polyprenyl-3-methyl-5-hydroxy-6-metoxy-1,4-benzoquinol methylase
MVQPLSRTEQQVQVSFDFEHQRYTAARYLCISPRLVEDWLADVQLPPDFFRGLTVLDVGCGSGRWTYALAALGARMVAVDFSETAVEITRAVTRAFDTVQVLQASLFHLPFEPGEFDFVVCWGVLHHTPDSAAAFRAIAPLVRRGGTLYVMVYEQHNPMKVIGTELLRVILRRLPPEARYRMCRKLVVRNRLLFQLLRGLITCIPASALHGELDAETAQFGLYDWYSPRYNHLHRLHEVREWFLQAGYGDLRVTSPVKHTRPVDVFRFGACGGSIKVRGTRAGREASCRIVSEAHARMPESVLKA